VRVAEGQEVAVLAQPVDVWAAVLGYEPLRALVTSGELTVEQVASSGLLLAALNDYHLEPDSGQVLAMVRDSGGRYRELWGRYLRDAEGLQVAWLRSRQALTAVLAAPGIVGLTAEHLMAEHPSAEDRALAALVASPSVLATVAGEPEAMVDLLSDPGRSLLVARSARLREALKNAPGLAWSLMTDPELLDQELWLGPLPNVAAAPGGGPADAQRLPVPPVPRAELPKPESRGEPSGGSVQRGSGAAPARAGDLPPLARAVNKHPGLVRYLVAEEAGQHVLAEVERYPELLPLLAKATGRIEGEIKDRPLLFAFSRFAEGLPEEQAGDFHRVYHRFLYAHLLDVFPDLLSELQPLLLGDKQIMAGMRQQWTRLKERQRRVADEPEAARQQRLASLRFDAPGTWVAAPGGWVKYAHTAPETAFTEIQRSEISKIAQTLLGAQERRTVLNSPLHAHLDRGDRGVAFAFVLNEDGHIGVFVYAKAEARQRNGYEWTRGRPTGGPPALESLELDEDPFIKASRRRVSAQTAARAGGVPAVVVAAAGDGRDASEAEQIAAALGDYNRAMALNRDGAPSAERVLASAKSRLKELRVEAPGPGTNPAAFPVFTGDAIRNGLKTVTGRELAKAMVTGDFHRYKFLSRQLSAWNGRTVYAGDPAPDRTDAVTADPTLPADSPLRARGVTGVLSPGERELLTPPDVVSSVGRQPAPVDPGSRGVTPPRPVLHAEPALVDQEFGLGQLLADAGLAGQLADGLDVSGAAVRQAITEAGAVLAGRIQELTTAQRPLARTNLVIRVPTEDTMAFGLALLLVSAIANHLHQPVALHLGPSGPLDVCPR
jgi:hypothetical protein